VVDVVDVSTTLMAATDSTPGNGPLGPCLHGRGGVAGALGGDRGRQWGGAGVPGGAGAVVVDEGDAGRDGRPGGCGGGVLVVPGAWGVPGVRRLGGCPGTRRRLLSWRHILASKRAEDPCDRDAGEHRGRGGATTQTHSSVMLHAMAMNPATTACDAYATVVRLEWR
jgi:hypothetical protein